MRGEDAFLADMLDAASRVQRYVAGKSFQEFLSDETLRDAVLWRLMIIGEGAKKVSPATRAALPLLPFAQIARMRDKIIHVYWGISDRVVWDTAVNDIPLLIRELSSRLGGGANPAGGSPP
jgi:uncharacterized protein with HEPN domain